MTRVVCGITRQKNVNSALRFSFKWSGSKDVKDTTTKQLVRVVEHLKAQPASNQEG